MWRNNEQKVKGFSGCNQFIGDYKKAGFYLKFLPLMSTKKACMAGMDTEAEYMSLLALVKYYSIHEETLSVLDAKKEKIAQFKAIHFN